MQVRELLEGCYRAVPKVTLVTDNLNTHGPASFYEAFSPAQARRLMDRLEIVYTPKHGSWLNMAEIELNVLAKQRLSRRIGDATTLAGEVRAWEERRNADGRRLAVHHRRCPRETQAALSANSNLTRY